MENSAMAERLATATQDQLKRQAAQAALEMVAPWLTPDGVVGVGTGTTTDYFIDALASVGAQFKAAVSSSDASTRRLRSHGIPVCDLNAIETVAAYVDGADEANPNRALVKGGGGALTREKIVAASAERFVCIVDQSKLVDVLGAFPLPVEVIPMARRLVARQLAQLGGKAVHRAGFVTDNGNHILDVHGFAIDDPEALESRINNIAGVVENGIFALAARPQTVLVGTAAGVRRID